MPSTPRAERRRPGLPTLLLFGLLLAGGAYTLANFPSPPQGPRYRGAGDPTPRSGGTFVFSTASSLRTLDPHIAYDEYGFLAIRLLFDGLIDYDLEGRFIPRLAEALPELSEDGRVYTFRLRPGVRFHNGRELVAEDVRWSFERMMAQDTGSPGYPFFRSLLGAEAFHEGRADAVEGIRVLDRYTVEFTLDEQDHTFMNALAMPFAYPVPRENVERWAKVSQSAVGLHPVGTGPFSLVEWERGVQLVFARFEGYYRPDEPHPDRMIYLENLSDEVPVARFRNGDLDFLSGIPAIHYLFFRAAPAWAPFLREAPTPTVFGLGLNCEMPPFDDVHVRRAVAFAIDREALKRLVQGRALPTGQPLPPTSRGYVEDMPEAQRYDLAAAREEMRLAGHPDGLDAPVTLWIGEGPGPLRTAQLFQRDLAQIGIEVELRQVSFAAYLEATGKPRTAQAFTTGWHMDYPDPSNILEVLFHSRGIRPVNSENRSFYRNPDFDRLIERARAETDADARDALYREASAIIAHDAPWAFLYNPLEMEVWQPYVRGYQPHPIWKNDFRSLWLDLPRERVDPNHYWQERAR